MVLNIIYMYRMMNRSIGDDGITNDQDTNKSSAFGPRLRREASETLQSSGQLSIINHQTQPNLIHYVWLLRIGYYLVIVS